MAGMINNKCDWFLIITYKLIKKIQTVTNLNIETTFSFDFML